jgi:cytochrome c peroxidase
MSRQILPILKKAACLALWLMAGAAAAQLGESSHPGKAPAEQEPITPIPEPPPADPGKLSLGEQLFMDPRLSRDGNVACVTCHDIHTNGADGNRQNVPNDRPKSRFATLSVFNATLNFHFNWEGNFWWLESHTRDSLKSPSGMAANIDEVVARLRADPVMVRLFQSVYRRQPDEAGLLNAIATYERSLLTPGSRFDRWLSGDAGALTRQELTGYRLFKSLGCVSCHQGVNLGGNLYERPGIFASPGPSQFALLRVPSLRNISVLGPYLHDGSVATLDEVVVKMAKTHVGRVLTGQEVEAVVAFLKTLTGNYRGTPVSEPPP